MSTFAKKEYPAISSAALSEARSLASVVANVLLPNMKTKSKDKAAQIKSFLCHVIRMLPPLPGLEIGKAILEAQIVRSLI